jgi:hypothetical protein
MLDSNEITLWMNDRASLLAKDGVETKIVQSPFVVDNPSVHLDVTTGEMLGRITGWASGEFDFEVVRISDEAKSLEVHIKARNLLDVESAYLEFQNALKDIKLSLLAYSKDFWIDLK